MSTKAKYCFAEALKELMKTKDIEHIKTTKIVEASGLTRQTFYRNFADKYELVNWYFERLVEKSFDEMGVSLSLEEGLVLKFQFIKREKIFFKQAFKTRDQNSLVDYDYNYILDFYKSKFKENGVELTSDILFSLELYCHGSISMTVAWCNSGMKESPEQVARMLVVAIPENLKKGFNTLK